MKKLIFVGIIILLLITILIIIAINKNKMQEEHSFKSISLNVSGTMIGEIYSYKIEEKNKKYYLIVEYTGINNNKPYKKSLKEETVKEIEKLIKKYDVDKWDNFNKVNQDVLDGESFSFNLEYKNKNKVYAEGSNSFPKNFFEFKEEYNDIIKKEAYKFLKKKNLI